MITRKGSRPFDANLASALLNIMSGDFKNRIFLIEESAQKCHSISLKGRQILCIVTQHFNLNKEDGSLLQINDLIRVELQNNTLRGFDTRWDTAIAALENQPSEDLLGNLYLKQLSKCDLLAVPLQIYHASVNHQGESQSY